MPLKPSPISVFWFVREGDKFIQCTKAGFDKAICEGKSVKFRGYQSKRVERIAEQLEESRMKFLADPATPTKFRAVLTQPRNVIEIEIVNVDDPSFWEKESKRLKYQ